eukprot:2747449-Rhodomonas_salina.1
MEEVGQHASEESSWIVVKGRVYDCTPFLEEHPGGAASITMNAGMDCTGPREALRAMCLCMQCASSVHRVCIECASSVHRVCMECAYVHMPKYLCILLRDMDFHVSGEMFGLASELGVRRSQRISRRCTLVRPGSSSRTTSSASLVPARALTDLLLVLDPRPSSRLY